MSWYTSPKTTVYDNRLVNSERSDISMQNQDRHDKHYISANTIYELISKLS